MEFLFVDESGDNGFSEGSTELFSLAGISIESTNWKAYFWKIKNLKQEIAQKYGLTFNELKGSDIFSHRGPFFNSLVTSSEDITWIYEQFMALICDSRAHLFAISLSEEEFLREQHQMAPKNLIKMFNERIWVEYLSMYDSHLLEKSKRTRTPETGIIYSDVNPGQEKYIRRIVKRFSTRFDPDMEFPEGGIIEDVVFRDSTSSYFIQLADILAFTINRLIIGRREKDIITINDLIRENLGHRINKPPCSL